MLEATKELEDIKQASDNLPRRIEVFVQWTCRKEDIAAKVEIIEANVKYELDLLPQGDKVLPGCQG